MTYYIYWENSIGLFVIYNCYILTVMLNIQPCPLTSWYLDALSRAELLPIPYWSTAPSNQQTLCWFDSDLPHKTYAAIVLQPSNCEWFIKIGRSATHWLLCCWRSLLFTEIACYGRTCWGFSGRNTPPAKPTCFHLFHCWRIDSEGLGSRWQNKKNHSWQFAEHISYTLNNSQTLGVCGLFRI